MFGQYRLLVGVISLAVCLDQATKALASARLPPSEVVAPLEGFLELRLRHNPGIGWGLGAGLPETTQRIIFPVVGLLVCGALVLLYRRLADASTARRLGVALLLGGGLGNIVDRVLWGHVIDFVGVRASVGGWSISGTFNLADTWMVVGLVVLAISTLAKRAGAAKEEGAMDVGGSP